MDDSENRTSNPRIEKGAQTIGDMIESRLSRRVLLGGGASAAALALAGCAAPGPAEDARAQSHPPQDPLNRDRAGRMAPDFSFPEITRGADETIHYPQGYTADRILAWGDALFADSPTFDPLNQSAAAQERQFGYNNDFIGYYPLDNRGAASSHGLLCVNHEYTSTFLMFPGLAESRALTREHCEIEMAAHGASIVEIRQNSRGAWKPVLTSRYNRRITGGSTKMQLTGPAAGSDRLKTRDDPSGRHVIGTLNNCAGGITPWGTYLLAEENFNKYFMGALPEGHAEKQNYARYGLTGESYQWGRYFDRFNLSRTPNEPNRFGWVVEVDILDPLSTPKKRTAMGRFKHEGAESVVAPGGQVVVYMGDDQRFDYVYKFVSARTVRTDNRAANMDLLDDGTLYVARFEESGDVHWLPLTFGKGPLTPLNRFYSQADVLIETRRAADLLGATPMDRPEDVEPDPKSGRVYVMLTNNSKRKVGEVNAANPRAANLFGHIIEITEPDGDFASTTSRWDILVKCGDPSDPAAGAEWNPATSKNGWFGSPDNCAMDAAGRLWVATDGNDDTGANDGIWALSTDGDLRGTGHAFFRAPNGAEVCGPRFCDDGRTLFLSVQHPGDGKNASFEHPTTRWPDFKDTMPARPSVLALRRKDRGRIGG